MNCIKDAILASRYNVMFREQLAGQNHKVKLGIELFERMELFKHMGTTVINQKKLRAY